MALKEANINEPAEMMVVGKITSVYGVKGWVKIYSDTEPMDNILKYTPWFVRLQGRLQAVQIEQGKRHGKGLIAKLVGCSDRDQAQAYCGNEISVDRSQLPALSGDDYYWHQLEKLNVVTESKEILGRVDHLISTGSNDVLVVQSTPESIDDRERLIPYLPEQVIKEINLEEGTIRVDWDSEF